MNKIVIGVVFTVFIFACQGETRLSEDYIKYRLDSLYASYEPFKTFWDDPRYTGYKYYFPLSEIEQQILGRWVPVNSEVNASFGYDIFFFPDYSCRINSSDTAVHFDGVWKIDNKLLVVKINQYSVAEGSLVTGIPIQPYELFICHVDSIFREGYINKKLSPTVRQVFNGKKNVEVQILYGDYYCRSFQTYEITAPQWGDENDFIEEYMKNIIERILAK